MKKRFIAAPAAAAALSLAVPALAAAAVGPVTVSVGANTSGTYNVSAATSSPIFFRVHGPAGIVEMTCASSSTPGVTDPSAASVTAGVDADGANIARIPQTNWSGCVGPFGIELEVEHIGTWEINNEDSSVAAGATETDVEGSISNISAHVTDASGLCDFTVTGTVDGHIDEVAQDLVVAEDGADASLKVDTVTADCLGSIAPTNEAEFDGTYHLNSPSGTIAIAP